LSTRPISLINCCENTVWQELFEGFFTRTRGEFSGKIARIDRFLASILERFRHHSAN
jgi:hypothetical protein